jgi:threonine dehydrogenase-like Zn-dependent dehydrogenase
MSCVIALSRNPARQELVREFGATDILASRGEEANEAVLKLTDSVGVDAALECVGTNEAMQTAPARGYTISINKREQGDTHDGAQRHAAC